MVVILLILLLVVLVIAVTSLLIIFFKQRSTDKKNYHNLIVVRDGVIVSGGGVDSRELLYGIDEDADTNLVESGLLCGKYIISLKNLKDGQTYQADFAESIWIGRDVDGEHHLHVEGKGISRQHCRFSIVNGQFYVEDLNSTNKTYVNGSVVREPVVVSDKTVVYLGEIPFSVQLSGM